MKILLIEDEIKTVQSLRQGLEEHEIEVAFAYDGLAGLRLALDGGFDVIVSDILMPELTGLELCRKLRHAGLETPVLLLTALGETDDKVSGLEAGADDYLAKPFEFRELLARIRALARRPRGSLAPNFTFADLTLNPDSKEVMRSGQRIELTPKEFALMEYFLRNPGRVISKTEIAEKVWDIDFETGTNTIEVYISYLRNKIDKPFERKLIHTQFGQGYILKVLDAV